jgi:leader peptidase (prepilin peptidase)/N-methyltransferase
MSAAAEARPEPVTAEGAFPRIRVPPGLVAVVAIFLATAALIHLDLSAEAFIAAGFCAVLTVLAAIDLERRIIPNRIVLPAGGLVLLANVIVHFGSDAWEYLIAATVGLLVAAAASLVTRGGVGMGDAKLCFLLGAGLGWSVLAALFVGSLGAAIASIVIIARHGMTARKQTIPFGPFLALGGVVVVFFA